MIRIYESFSEFAEDFVDGEKRAHALSPHSPDECYGWQKGVKEFAQWIDDAGGKLLCEPDIFEKLWDTYGTEQAADQEHPLSTGDSGAD